MGGCKTGKAKLTKAYKLPCKYIIHTVGPKWKKGKKNEEDLLAQCYYNSLFLAVENGIRSIAFPSVSTGIYHFPLEKAAEIAVFTVRSFVDEHPNQIDKVVWVLFDEKTFDAYDTVLKNI